MTGVATATGAGAGGGVGAIAIGGTATGGEAGISIIRSTVTTLGVEAVCTGLGVASLTGGVSTRAATLFLRFCWAAVTVWACSARANLVLRISTSCAKFCCKDSLVACNGGVEETKLFLGR